MHYELIVTGLALHILIWDKLPEWGKGFNWLLQRMPKPVQGLYEDWRCPYCFGFWAILALHGMTGNYVFPHLASIGDELNDFGILLSWFLDALAGATLIYFAYFVLWACMLPAMKAHTMKADFMKEQVEKGLKEEV